MTITTDPTAQKSIPSTGWYDGKILSCHLREQNDKPFLLVQADIETHEVYSRMYLTPAAAPYTAKTLRKLGYRGSFGDFAKADNTHLSGMEVRVKISHRQGDDGKTYYDANIYAGGPADDAGSDVVAAASAFDALLQGEDEDDVPF